MPRRSPVKIDGSAERKHHLGQDGRLAGAHHARRAEQQQIGVAHAVGRVHDDRIEGAEADEEQRAGVVDAEHGDGERQPGGDRHRAQQLDRSDRPAAPPAGSSRRTGRAGCRRARRGESPAARGARSRGRRPPRCPSTATSSAWAGRRSTSTRTARTCTGEGMMPFDDPVAVHRHRPQREKGQRQEHRPREAPRDRVPAVRRRHPVGHRGYWFWPRSAADFPVALVRKS